MKTTLSHEFYKMTHQRSSWLAIIVLFGLMLYASTPTAYINKGLVSQGFGAGQWVIIIIITLSSNFIAMEFRNNTMTTLLYKSPNRRSVFLSKLIVLVVYSFFLLAVSFLLALLIKFLLVNSRFDWNTIYHQHSLIINLLINLAGIAIYLLFIVTLSLMLITIIKSNAIVIVIGLFVGFLGSTISDVMMNALPGIKGILAWNPLNMINIITQLSGSNGAPISGLTNAALVAGNLIYAIIFLFIGLWAFKKRPL